jgi:hypothetical protein
VICSIDATYPSCVTYVFSDATYSGYTLFGCGKTATRVAVYANPLTSSITTTSSSLRTTPTTPTTTTPTTFSIPSTSTDDPFTSTPTPTPAPAASNSTPIGAIVGGVVGGIGKFPPMSIQEPFAFGMTNMTSTGALALITAGIFFLIRRNKKDANANANASTTNPQMQSPPPPGNQGPFGPAVAGGMYAAQQSPQPQMAQQQPQQQPQQMTGYPPPVGYAAAGAYPPPGFDPRSSIAKHPYDMSQSSYDPSLASPPGSPPPQQSPVPPYSGVGYGPGGVPYNAQQQQQVYSPSPVSPNSTGYNNAPHTGQNTAYPNNSGPHTPATHVSELPAVRQDPGPRELA